MEFIAYIITDSKGKEYQNSIKIGRKHCIDSFLEYAPYSDWSCAKSLGCRCEICLDHQPKLVRCDAPNAFQCTYKCQYHMDMLWPKQDKEKKLTATTPTKIEKKREDLADMIRSEMEDLNTYIDTFVDLGDTKRTAWDVVSQIAKIMEMCTDLIRTYDFYVSIEQKPVAYVVKVEPTR